MSVKKVQGAGKTTLIIILIIFMLPFFAALAIYKFDAWPQKTTNHGTLIQPAIAINDIMFISSDGEEFNGEKLKGVWWLLYSHQGPCEVTCQKNVYIMRQVNVALGKHANRVKRLYLVPLSQEKSASKLFNKKYPLMQVSGADFIALQNIMNPKITDFQDVIFIIDPLGHIMMHYPKDETGKGLLKDLNHLLKNSRIG